MLLLCCQYVCLLCGAAGRCLPRTDDMMATQGLGSVRLVLCTRSTLSGGRRIGFLEDILGVFFLVLFFRRGRCYGGGNGISRVAVVRVSRSTTVDGCSDPGWSQKISGHVLTVILRFKFCGTLLVGFWRGSALERLSHWRQLSDISREMIGCELEM